MNTESMRAAIYAQELGRLSEMTVENRIKCAELAVQAFDRLLQKTVGPQDVDVLHMPRALLQVFAQQLSSINNNLRASVPGDAFKRLAVDFSALRDCAGQMQNWAWGPSWPMSDASTLPPNQLIKQLEDLRTLVLRNYKIISSPHFHQLLEDVNKVIDRLRTVQ